MMMIKQSECEEKNAIIIAKIRRNGRECDRQRSAREYTIKKNWDCFSFEVCCSISICVGRWLRWQMRDGEKIGGDDKSGAAKVKP